MRDVFVCYEILKYCNAPPSRKIEKHCYRLSAVGIILAEHAQKAYGVVRGMQFVLFDLDLVQKYSTYSVIQKTHTRSYTLKRRDIEGTDRTR